MPADKYEADIKSVADYIKSSVDEVKGVTRKNTTNGPDGTISSTTVSSVQMLFDGVQKLNTNIQLVNGNFYGDLKSCMTGQVESLRATHHHKHEAGAHVIDYARGFGDKSSKRRLEKNNSVGCPLLHKQEVLLSCAIQLNQLLGHLISVTFTNCSDGREGPRTHEGMGAQQRKKCTSENCSTRNHQVQGRHPPP